MGGFMIRAALLCGLVGHLLCWYCDILLTYTPGHRFHAEHIKDNAKLAEVFSELDPSGQCGLCCWALRQLPWKL